jgi:hypothetical protein
MVLWKSKKIKEQSKESSVVDQLFHENYKFFEVFEIIETNLLFDFDFSQRTGTTCFLILKCLIKEPQLPVLYKIREPSNTGTNLNFCNLIQFSILQSAMSITT